MAAQNIDRDASLIQKLRNTVEHLENQEEKKESLGMANGIVDRKVFPSEIDTMIQMLEEVGMHKSVQDYVLSVIKKQVEENNHLRSINHAAKSAFDRMRDERNEAQKELVEFKVMAEHGDDKDRMVREACRRGWRHLRF